jgi:hypothetical protein
LLDCLKYAQFRLRSGFSQCFSAPQ